jgi:hypothetical protein
MNHTHISEESLHQAADMNIISYDQANMLWQRLKQPIGAESLLLMVDQQILTHEQADNLWGWLNRFPKGQEKEEPTSILSIILYILLAIFVMAILAFVALFLMCLSGGGGKFM